MAKRRLRVACPTCGEQHFFDASDLFDDPQVVEVTVVVRAGTAAAHAVRVRRPAPVHRRSPSLFPHAEEPPRPDGRAR